MGEMIKCKRNLPWTSTRCASECAGAFLLGYLWEGAWLMSYALVFSWLLNSMKNFIEKSYEGQGTA